LIVELFDGNVR